MNLVKCRNGHYYDGDKFDACPHCRGAASSMTENSEEVTVPMEAVPELSTAITEPVTVPGEKIENIIQQDDEKTVGYYITDMGTEPVVGWLVCIEGSDFGKSFNLKAGKNFVGRNVDVNDVVLQGDHSVSREKHAIVIYDPKSRVFLVQPGMSSELFYVNDKVVLQATGIKARDVIAVGSTKLMFVPCCGPDFTWDDYKKEEQ